MNEFRILKNDTSVEIQTRNNGQEWEFNAFYGNLMTKDNPAVSINVIDKISKLKNEGYVLTDVINNVKDINTKTKANHSVLQSIKSQKEKAMKQKETNVKKMAKSVDKSLSK